MTLRALVSGKGSFRSHLRSHLPRLRRAPCLLVSSSPPPEATGGPPKKVDQSLKVFIGDVGDFVTKANFVSSMELGLRTVHGTVASAFPTWHDVEGCVEVARRSGATSVIGAGAGSAIDLAKATASALSGHGGDTVDLVLAPATMGGAMAAMTSRSMILSQEEEALLPAEIACATGSSPRGAFTDVAATVTLDGDGMAVPDFVHDSSRRPAANIADAAFGSLAVCIDAAHALPDYDEHVNNLIVSAVDNSLAAISSDTKGRDEEDIKLAKSHAISATVHAGQLLDLTSGVGMVRRSIPLAVASSLLPRYFPHGHILTLFASMMHGLCMALSNDASESVALQNVSKSITDGGTFSELVSWTDEVNKKAEVPSMASLAEGAPDISSMLGRLDANAALLNCKDAQLNVIEEVLRRSLNR